MLSLDVIEKVANLRLYSGVLMEGIGKTGKVDRGDAVVGLERMRQNGRI